MNTKLTLLLASVLTVLPIFGMTEETKALSDKVATMMKEEIDANQARNVDGKESENLRLKDILSEYVAEQQNVRFDESTVVKVIAYFKNPQLKEAAHQLIRSLQQEAKDKDEADIREVQDKLDHIKSLVKDSKDPAAFEDLILQINQFNQTHHYNSRNQRLGDLVGDLRGMKRFLESWKNYLAAMQRQNFDEARQTLDIAMNSSSSINQLIFPRSELIDRWTQLTERIDQIEQLPDTYPEVINRIHSLEDIALAIQEIEKLQSYASDVNIRNNPIPPLKALDRAYRAYLADQPYSIALDEEFIIEEGVFYCGVGAFKRNAAIANIRLIQLRAELLTLILPRYLEAPESVQPEKDETVMHYLDRLTAYAVSHKDGDLLSRIENAWAEEFRTVIPNHSNDTARYRMYHKGIRNEEAQQLDAAVRLYQEALQCNSEFISDQEIGQRLKSIQQSHPEDYQRGMNTFLENYWEFRTVKPFVPPPPSESKTKDSESPSK